MSRNRARWRLPAAVATGLLTVACTSSVTTEVPSAAGGTPSHYERIVSCVQQQGAPGMVNNPQAARATLGCAKGTGQLTSKEKKCAVKVANAGYPLVKYQHKLAACW